MLKLKYLFDNSELALMLLKNWNYDDESVGLFKYYRISSNAIYPFKNHGKTHFLRFVPASEKDNKCISQEIEFMNILSNNEFNVPNVIKSKFGNLIETKKTPWGFYHAVVFESVGDETLESIEMTEEIAYQYGKSLAKLHEISKEEVQSNFERNSIFDIFNMIEGKFVKDTFDTTILLDHLNVLRKKFEKLDITNQSFGLIHYDYELDNIIYDTETQKLSAIDFDDCMYGFYGQDVERAINSIESELGEFHKVAKASFINGYLEAGGNLEMYNNNRELFKSFADLYSYFRVSSSLEEKWDNEPEWMENLRNRLSERMTKYLEKLES